jgi:ribonuclease HIII
MGLVKTGWTRKSEPRIGVDESGKGDYFGPLVIAGALITPEQEPDLIRLGVRDSKSISDSSIKKTAAELGKILPHTKIAIGPKKYNALHLQMKNVNRILAWGHARAIENLLEKHPVQLAVSDQFGDESLILNALMQKGKNIKLVQRHRGEEDLAVACASILARAEFLLRLEQLSKHFGVNLPKGMSDLTLKAGRQLVNKAGERALEEAAKIHFKTTAKILAEH